MALVIDTSSKKNELAEQAGQLRAQYGDDMEALEVAAELERAFTILELLCTSKPRVFQGMRGEFPRQQ